MSVLTLNVNEVMRTLSAESSSPFVAHDKEVDIVRFAINSGFADIVLDGQVALRVMYQRPRETEVRAQTLTYYDTDGLHNYYDWQLSQSDLAKNGSLMVALCILDISGGEVSEWHTTPCAVRVLSTIHTDDSDEGDDTITPTVKERVAVLETMIQRVASGAPIVVSSASAMTDTDQIYVLKTDGRWYYHNGSAWVSGGTYGAVATDSTLTQSGIPADAKVVGDKITDLKSDLIKNTIYEVDDFTNIRLIKGYMVNTLGRPGTASNSISNYALTSPYVYAGSAITINDGYIGSYAVWKAPVASSSPVTERLELNRNISAGTTATIKHDGYLFCSAQTSDGSDLPSDKTPLEIISEALTINLLSGTVKDKIEEKIDKKQGSENAGKVLMVALTGDVTPETIPDPTECTQVNTNYKYGQTSGKGVVTTHKSAIISDPIPVKAFDYVTVDDGLYLKISLYSSATTNDSTFIKHYAWTNSGRITIDADGYALVCVSDAEHYNIFGSVLPNTDYQYSTHIYVQRTAFEIISGIKSTLTEKRTITNKTGLFEAQQAVASDWHLPFINMYDALGLGNNHQIPGTAKTWSDSGVTDLTQKNVWMSDGTHPYRGVGLVDMYGRTIANQLALVSPSYHDGEGQTSPSYWAGKRLLWMGTSIPAGSDPDAGSGTGATYPQMVATQLGATSVNIARGSSMLRVKSSTGLYNAIPFSHYARAITRMVAECDEIAANWENIHADIANAPAELTAENVTTMKNHSFENLIVPYLDGTNTAPDLYVIDYGHNDYANGIDGKRDWWVEPNTENIESGLLAEDTYMVANDYANLKLALNNDLTGISDLREFSASLNRNCFQGACNFLITLILRYKPYARIAIVSDYN